MKRLEGLYCSKLPDIESVGAMEVVVKSRCAAESVRLARVDATLLHPFIAKKTSAPTNMTMDHDSNAIQAKFILMILVLPVGS